MTDQPIFDKIRPIIAAHFDISPQDISKNTNLMYDLGADSLDIAELWITFEKMFGFRTPSQNAAGSVLTIWDYVDPDNLTIDVCVKRIQEFVKKHPIVLWLAVQKQKLTKSTNQKFRTK